MRGITAETSAWLSILKNYRRTNHWRAIESAVLTKHSYNCAQCGMSADTVKHLTYLTIGRETESDVTVYCHSCRAAAGKANPVAPGYLSSEVKERILAFLQTNPPLRSSYTKSIKNRIPVPGPLSGSNLDIAYARSLYLGLLLLAGKSRTRFITVQRFQLAKLVFMSPRLITRALNVLQNAGWIYRRLKHSVSDVGVRNSSIVVELRRNVDKMLQFTRSREQE